MTKISPMGDWSVIEATYRTSDESTNIRGVIQFACKNGAVFDETSVLRITTPQVEKNALRSSFIVTGDVPATRASDMVKIPATCNWGDAPFTLLCEVSVSWDIPPNAAPRTLNVSRLDTENNNEHYIYQFFNGSAEKLTTGLGASPATYYSVATATNKHAVSGFRVNNVNQMQTISNGVVSTAVDIPYKVRFVPGDLVFGGQTSAGLRHLFGHVRNLRIWHKELNDRQIKEAV